MKSKITTLLLTMLFMTLLAITNPLSPALAQGTELYIDPALTTKTPSDVNKRFWVSIEIEDVTDLFGFDLNITWDSNMITYYDNDTTPLNTIWPAKWTASIERNTPGSYKLVALSTGGSGTGFTGDGTLFKLQLNVEAPICNQPADWETSIDFTLVKLSNSTWGKIIPTVTNGTYRMTGLKPDLEMIPEEIMCRKYCENFTIQIYVTHAINVHDFHFEIWFNTTLLDYVVDSDVWGDLGLGTITKIDEEYGVLEGNVTGGAGIVVNGNQWLLNITFHAAYYYIWKDMTACPNWINDLHGVIKLHWAQLTYLECEPLTYQEEGPLKEIDVFPAGGVIYTFSPIQGDINNDGTVNIQDISLVAWWYEQDHPACDLNCDGIVDIFDLVIVASNLWYTYN